MTPQAKKARRWSILLGFTTTLAVLAVAALGVVLASMALLAQGPDLVIVPQVVGEPFEEAKRILESSGLQAKQMVVAYSDEVPLGAVISQRPAARMRVKEGRLVELVVSQGPKSVKVPNVLGRPLAEAEEAIGKAYLKVGEVRRVVSDRPEGTVSGQEPTAGAVLGRDEKVNLRVSGGPKLGSWTDPDGREWLFRTIRIVVPAGESLQRVRVVVKRGGEEEVVYDEIRRPGDRLSLDVRGRKGARVSVLLEDKEIFEQAL